MANSKPRKAIRSDVLDELDFIAGDAVHYTCGQRQKASNLMHVLKKIDFDPTEQIANVINIYGNHDFEMPKALRTPAGVK